MCGIIGYIGIKNAQEIVIDSLSRLEYRGYDSAGISIINSNGIKTIKTAGRIKELRKKLEKFSLNGSIAIGHTRWATHGEPSDKNAHPHFCRHGKIAVAHNGIIENYKKIKEQLIQKGHKFQSETDSEVIAHLIGEFYKGDLVQAVSTAVRHLKGAFGIAVICGKEPDKLVAAKLGSPLVLGIGNQGNIIASDVSAIINHTRQVIYLEDGEIAEIARDDFKIFNSKNKEIRRASKEIEWDLGQAEKNGYPHFMLKEIFEQPETLQNSIRGRLIIKEGKSKLGGLESVTSRLKNINHLTIVACGTAYYAGLVGKYFLEEYAGLKTAVETASEFRYRKSVISKDTALLAISQSGETADTLAAVKEAKEKEILTLGIVNTVGSTIARETDAGIYNHIGPEISVASTKAFTSQIAILVLIAVFLGRQRQMSLIMGKRILSELNQLPAKIADVLKQSEAIADIAGKYKNAKNFAYLARKYNSPIAYEGALKLKELSYIHAEGFFSGEFKHGPIALIDKDFPSLFIAPSDSVYEKNISNIEEVKTRGGRIIALATEGNNEITEKADDVIFIPKTLEMLTPILSVVVLQLFAYHITMLSGRNNNIDKPRNLAKSVTVE